MRMSCTTWCQFGVQRLSCKPLPLKDPLAPIYIAQFFYVFICWIGLGVPPHLKYFQFRLQSRIAQLVMNACSPDRLYCKCHSFFKAVP
jgi:hypothetical protein